MVDIHRHGEFSSFDGFGKAKELARHAKELGYTSHSISDHGVTNGWVQHYNACKEVGINCIMGVEAYFQPVWNKEQPRYHLCLFVKNLTGYRNLCKLMSLAEKQRYYKPIVTFADLEKYSEGVICTTACIQGYIPRAVEAGKQELAHKVVEKFKNIYGEDFYIEIQPYRIDHKHTQENVNERLMWLADDHGVKCILTSDSHFGSKEDFPTYLKMHEVKSSDDAGGYDITETYGERYMPTMAELGERFVAMHEVSGDKRRAKVMLANLVEIENKVEQGILDQLQLQLPTVPGDSMNVLMRLVKDGLREHGKTGADTAYIQRCQEELRVIKMHGFADYFLIVRDFIKYAESKGIAVGPGRGSVCNCQVAYEIGITKVDSLRFGLNFQRFMRDDKKKLPDIDVDIETDGQQVVIDYLMQKYEGCAARVCSYGKYRVDNLANDLVKACGMDERPEEIRRLKAYLQARTDETYHFSYDPRDPDAVYFNAQYDGIVEHFSKMIGKVRFIGTHAAGVAISSAPITDYCVVRHVRDAKDGVTREYTSYDLADLESVQLVKFDILGLRTMSSLGELRRMLGKNGVEEWMYEDDVIMNMFANGDTEGVFQFERDTPRNILREIQADSFEDITAVNSMNRPGPLSVKMPERYAHNKHNVQDVQRANPIYEWTKETYGTMVYQEQLMRITVEAGGFTWAEADKLMKLIKDKNATTADVDADEAIRDELIAKFIKNAHANGWTMEQATEMSVGIMAYVFNKGHATGYSMIALEEMYYKVYHPREFWYVKMKYFGAGKANASKLRMFKQQAIASDTVIFLPHVNYTADYSLRVEEDDSVIQEGLTSIDGIGDKAAEFIEKERKEHGPFYSYDDFYNRCKRKGSPVTVGVIKKLQEHGALEFNRGVYINRVTKYNSVLYSASLRG